LAILIAISSVSAIFSDRFSTKSLYGKIFQGLLFGFAAAVGILYPVVLSPGVIFDGRSVVISLCALFFGPVSAAISSTMAIATRVVVGGGGVLMGILVILSTAGIGVFFHYHTKIIQVRLNYLNLYLFGLLVHIVMVACMLTLPPENALTALKQVSLPVMIFYPIATVIVGKLLKDTHDRMQAHEDLIIQKEKAEQSSRLKDAFIASISHEIRTPLNAILGFSSIIEEEAGERFTVEEHGYFKKINHSGERLTRTIDEILNYSKLKVSDLVIQKTIIHLPRLIEALIEESRINHPDDEIGVFFENKLGDIELNLDDFSIKTCIANLLDNALKYTKAGTILVSLYRDNQGMINISVKDPGIGISKAYLEKIFEPYSQEDTGYDRRYEGIGLGLSIVKQLCIIMNARISVESEKGVGSIFTLTLPIEKIDEP